MDGSEFSPSSIPFIPDAPPAAPPALTQERLAATLHRRGARVVLDGDGDFGGRWNDHLIYILRPGKDREFLQVRGRWQRPAPASLLPRMLVTLNEWHVEKLFPKGYARIEGDSLGVYAEHTMSYEFGVTDAQIDLHLNWAISTTLRMFDHLDTVFPDVAAEGRALLTKADE
ncbi:YbjN domain-containing protein [Cellulomonas composti]|uniref:YbjN domain-containing protein n=1 Tax=Cellulomonas composti TaxID=266130 RepID=A0A511J8G7_9CELL|nr:YbjN domain-containing protein [Cellulomonas composti]GEL94278.1 hypothetical protein CCO02nite_09360 [Cellulomonas composti]